MTTKELDGLLKGVPGFRGKVTYYQWPINRAPDLPFVCYFSTEETELGADNVTYFAQPLFRVELYSRTRELELEALFEQAFTAAGHYYRKESEFIDDENVWMTVFYL